MPRLAIVASHPVQYQAPWFRALAEQVDVHVFFCHRQSAEDQARAGFGTPFEWDVPLLDGYEHSWLQNVAAAPNSSGPWSPKPWPCCPRPPNSGRVPSFRR